MARAPGYRDHLNSAADLETTYEQRRAGFVAMALERGRRAIPHIAQARALKAIAGKIPRPALLANTEEFRDSLVAAAGVSDKAAGHFENDDKLAAIHRLIREFLEPAGEKWVEELVYRFLLTRGDSLGGELRNVAGALAQRRFAQFLVATLQILRIEYHWLETNSGRWIGSVHRQFSMESRIKAMTWQRGENNRTLAYNVKVSIVENNIDMSVLNARRNDFATARKDPARYLAIGELKGGIDPAGADEHWKTARTAISRIRTSFADHELSPKLFFVGGAIVEAMAGEIWTQLGNGSLANAANLNSDDQLASFCQWIVRL